MLVSAAQPAKPALDGAAARWVEQTLRKMSLDEKVGQLLVPSLDATFTSTGSDTFEQLGHLVRDLKVGGMHVFGTSEPFPALLLNPTYGNGGSSRKGDPYAAAALLNRLQKLADVPLLTTADFEGGVGYIMNGATRLPRAMAIAATRDTGLAYRAGRVSAEEGRALGVAVDFYPIVDVNNNARNRRSRPRSTPASAPSCRRTSRCPRSIPAWCRERRSRCDRRRRSAARFSPACCATR